MAKPSSMPRLVLILGGARSGKSRFALELAAKSGQRVLFAATAQALDEEMSARIAEHRKGRPAHWRTLEAPLRLADSLKSAVGDAEVVVVDCLTLLVSNVMGSASDRERADVMVAAEVESLLDCIKDTKAYFIVVSNEVGLGIVPDNELARSYRDLLGGANQALAGQADEVYFMSAGLPLKIK